MKGITLLLVLIIFTMTFPINTLAEICFEKHTQKDKLEFQKDPRYGYYINVWVVVDDTPAFDCYRIKSEIRNKLSIKYRFRVVNGNYKIKYNGDDWSLLVGGIAQSISKESIVGWVQHSNLILSNNSLKSYGSRIHSKVLLKEPIYSVYMHPNPEKRYVKSYEQKRKHTYYYIYDFFPRTSAFPDNTKTKRVLIGLDFFLDTMETLANGLIVWVDQSNISYWKTRNACEFKLNHKVKLLSETGDFLFLSVVDKPLEYDEMKYPILNEDSSNYYIGAFFEDKYVEGWVDKNKVNKCILVSRTDIERITTFLTNLIESTNTNIKDRKAHWEDTVKIIIGDHDCFINNTHISLKECNMITNGIPIPADFMLLELHHFLNLSGKKANDLQCEARIVREQFRTFVNNQYIKKIIVNPDICDFDLVYYEDDINGDGVIVHKSNAINSYKIDKYFFTTSISKHRDTMAWIPVKHLYATRVNKGESTYRLDSKLSNMKKKQVI